jgi:outer membrane protein assembly factor BamE (lipoprotein component of BamABCDE complex)
MRYLTFEAALAAVLLAAGCTIQRSRLATEAQKAMIGMPKTDVLACMGIPAARASQDDSEVWSYNSGDGRVVSFNTANAFGGGQSFTNGNATVNGNSANFSSQSFGTSSMSMFGSGVSQRFYCTVNVIFKNDIVYKINYVGPTGPSLAPGEQCAYAVKNCVN